MNLALIGLLRRGLSLAYTVFKVLPADGRKVVFLSRQSDTIPLDFALLADRLAGASADVHLVFRCRQMGNTYRQKVAYALRLLGDAYHLATARVAVLDSYSVAVSVLHHKPSLYVIQLWHAMGKIKQSGFANLGKPYGRDPRLAAALRMHANNNLVAAGAPAWNKFYRASFGPGDYQLLNVGLPRLDHLLSDGPAIRERLLARYPELVNKTVLLYAPTWRNNGHSGTAQLAQHVDFDTCALVTREHRIGANEDVADPRQTVIDADVATIDLLSVCDYLITDYSAIAVEAAAIHVKTLYYLFDYADYALNNGLNIDLFTEMPGCVFEDAADLLAVVRSGCYNLAALDNYRAKYVPATPGQATQTISEIILKHLEAG